MSWYNLFFHFYNVGERFLTNFLVNLDTMLLFLNLDVAFNNSFTSFIVDFLVIFLVDSLMHLCITFMVLKILIFFSSGLIQMNSQSNYFSNAFFLCISLLVFLSL